MVTRRNCIIQFSPSRAGVHAYVEKRGSLAYTIIWTWIRMESPEELISVLEGNTDYINV